MSVGDANLKEIIVIKSGMASKRPEGGRGNETLKRDSI